MFHSSFWVLSPWPLWSWGSVCWAWWSCTHQNLHQTRVCTHTHTHANANMNLLLTVTKVMYYQEYAAFFKLTVGWYTVIVPQQLLFGHCLCDFTLHSCWKSNQRKLRWTDGVPTSPDIVVPVVADGLFGLCGSEHLDELFIPTWSLP